MSAPGSSAPPPLGGGLVLGLGIDMVEIARIERSIERFGDRFTHRVFTEAERRLCDGRARTRAQSYARRWAAKEACAKALGTGVWGRADTVGFTDIEVLRADHGAPSIALHGAAERRARRLAATRGLAGARVEALLSMTDEPPFAQAIALLQAVWINSRDVPGSG